MKNTTALPALLTVEEVGEQLGISRARVYQLLNKGELRSLHVGRLRRITAEDLADYIASLRDQSA